MFIRAGLDIGSTLAKAIIMNDKEIMSYNIRSISGNFATAAKDVFQKVLNNCNLSYKDINIIGGTGIGASFIEYPFVKNTEVSCQSRGVHYLLPSAKIVIEIGDQSSRVIKITEQGRVADCVVNDKCAAGSGRILQIIARVLGIDFQHMGELSLKSTNPVHFSTGCSVFIETEAISRIAEGAKIEDIVAGLHRSIAIKIGSMVERLKVDGDYAITGGGAKDLGLVKMIEKTINKELLIPEEPLISGAVGAALKATEE